MCWNKVQTIYIWLGNSLKEHYYNGEIDKIQISERLYVVHFVTNCREAHGNIYTDVALKTGEGCKMNGRSNESLSNS
jgi:hypothetical protein